MDIVDSLPNSNPVQEVERMDSQDQVDGEEEVDAKPSWADDLLEAVVGKKLPTANMPVSRNADRYNMNHKNRGKAVIFNHKEFTNGQSTRNGTEKDEQRLKLCLGALGFEVIVHRDLKRIKLLSTLDRLAKEDHSDSDCLLICVLSHGEQDKIFCADSEYRPEELWNPFTAINSPTLAGKPKLYFIQACRGDQLDSGIQLKQMSRNQTDSLPQKDDSIYVVPNRADFLIVFSTAPGYYSWRNTSEGSWFIQSLTKVIDTHKDNKDLLSMMTIVARAVALDFESNVPGNPTFDQKKQIPMISSTLIRDVYL